MTNEVTRESKRRWDLFAEDYAKRTSKFGDLHKEVLLTPTILSLLEDVDGQKILDAGCGEGYFSRLLAEKGAYVTAVDFSARMLDIARERTSNDVAIDYRQADLEDLNELESGLFDQVMSNMAVQDVAHLDGVLGEIHRVLKPGGTFVFSILHPCFVTPESGWHRDEHGNGLHWKTDHYFEEGQFEQRFGTKERVFGFHRTLTTYMNALFSTGFTLETLIEPAPSEENLEKYPDFKEDLRAPDFIVLRQKTLASISG